LLPKPAIESDDERMFADRTTSEHGGTRWAPRGRCSAVAFGGAGETRTNRQTSTTTQSIGSGGFGFRYELASKFGMHAGIDVAHSPGTTAVYLVVGNAWFRP